MSIHDKIITSLVNSKVDFVTTVPCKQLGGVIERIQNHPDIQHVPATKEDEGMGLCAGAYMGGKRPCIFMQNTALGVTANTLATLIQFYQIPLPMLISYRGEVGERVACQVEMAIHTKAILNQMHIQTYHFHDPEDVDELDAILNHTFMCKKPTAILTDATFGEANKMIRSEVLQTLVPVLSDELVVCNIGLPSQELYMLDDQPSNFYMLGTMGLCSSIGFGLALAQEEKVIAIDGDGSVLTNMGTLSTIANNAQDNFILFIVDNGSYGSTGDQPTYAGGKTSLAKVAEACGCENVIECQGESAADVLQKALAANTMTIIVCKCESGNIPVSVIELDAPVIKHRFMEEVNKRQAG